MPPALRRKSCFIIAPYDVPLGSFLETLRQEQIEPFFISDFLKLGEPSTSAIRYAFRSVDLVVALLFRGRQLDNVLFELGMAVGLGRPILLFASSPLNLPAELSDLRINYVDLTQLENTLPAIRKWFEPKRKSDQIEFIGKAPTSLDKSRRRIRGTALRDELRRTRDVWTYSQDSRQIETELSHLLSELGWTVVQARASARNQAPDLALWIDEIQKDTGNPLAVEVKANLTDAGLESAVRQLSRYLSAAGAKAGLLFYKGPELQLDHNIAQNAPPILAFSLNQFADLIEDEKFPSALKSSLSEAKRRG